MTSSCDCVLKRKRHRASGIALATFASVSVSAQQPTPTPAAGDTLLYPERITITADFQVPFGPTAAERALRTAGEQIEAKRAADAARSQLQPLWDAAVWRYLPTDPVRTLNSRVAADDDPFFTPEYLKVSGRQLDRELKLSDQTGRGFLQH